MNQTLWEQSSWPVSDPEPDRYFASWDEFVKEEPWKQNCIYGTKPVHWNWFDKQCEDYLEHLEEFEITDDNGINVLDLIWLCTYSFRSQRVSIAVEKKDEQKIKLWMVKHGFLQGEDV